jgi:hypothetical protein
MTVRKKITGSKKKIGQKGSEKGVLTVTVILRIERAG